MRTVAIIGLLGMARIANASVADSTALPYDSAVAAYARGDHQRALDGFSAIARDQESAALSFNIGNCWYKLNDVPHAVLWYERAQLLAPGAEDIRENLDLVRTMVVDRVNELPGFSLGSTWESIRGGGDPDRWAVLSLWACLILFAALAGFVLLRGAWPRRLAAIVAGLSLTATLVCTSFAWQRHTEMTAHNAAIIMVPKADITSEPRKEATLLFVLHEGTKVDVLEQRGSWCSIKIANGDVGWMPVNGLERI